MRVAFRTDSSFAMATGHVTRCLALEAELRRRGVKTSFVTRKLPGAAAFLIAEQGVSLHRLPAPRSENATIGDGPRHESWLGETWTTDAEQTEAILEDDVDWLVVDHYGLDARWARSRVTPNLSTAWRSAPTASESSVEVGTKP